MANMTLLDDPRIGILITNKQDGSPLGVPVWFDWDGEMVRCFAAKDSKKMKRIARNPRASLLVTNNIGEREAWVAFDGEFSIKDEGGLELAEKLAPAYWDLTDAKNAEMLALWRSAPEAFALLELKPSNIRTGN